MNAGFRTLWTLSVSHAFFGGRCDVLRFVVPPATQQVLQAMKARLREAEGQLHVAVEVDEHGVPLVDCTGLTLSFGLQVRDPAFARYTDPMGVGRGQQAFFTQGASLDAIAAQPQSVRVVPPRVSLSPLRTTRPLGLRVQTANGLPRAATTLGPTDASWAWDAGSLQGLVHLVEEDRPGHVVATQALFVAAGLAACWGVLQLTVSASQVAAVASGPGHTFTLALPARSDVLRYYLLVKPTDANAFIVTDDRLSVPEVDRLQFTRHLPPLPDGCLSPDLLDPGHTRQVVLFEANAPLARQARGPQGIGLHRSGEAVIANLPQPGADRNDAQFVVQLSQP
ncbi:MAG: hypothetical protein RI907_1167 [Pseudomonadota bacterium]